MAHTYSGPDQFLDYFSTLSKVLNIKMDAAPAMDEFAVQVGAGPGGQGVVFVQGGGEFEAIKTGKKWRESYVHEFSEFDEEGRI